jgi:hypothetical protein
MAKGGVQSINCVGQYLDVLYYLFPPFVSPVKVDLAAKNEALAWTSRHFWSSTVGSNLLKIGGQFYDRHFQRFLPILGDFCRFSAIFARFKIFLPVFCENFADFLHTNVISFFIGVKISIFSECFRQKYFKSKNVAPRK